MRGIGGGCLEVGQNEGPVGSEARWIRRANRFRASFQVAGGGLRLRVAGWGGSLRRSMGRDVIAITSVRIGR